MKMMKTGDLMLGLNDLFTQKIALIRSLMAFALFGPSLEKMREVLGNIHRGMTNAPLVERLKLSDLIHDGAGRLLYHLCEDFSKFVNLTKEQRAFWAELKATFIPQLGILKASYADQAAAATERLTILESRKTELETYMLPYEMTLYALIETYLLAGIELGTLLSDRAGEQVDDETKRTKQLHIVRSETIGFLNEFRKALAQEVRVNESLPRDLEAQVFAYFDKLEEKRETSDTQAPKETETAAAAQS